VYLTTLGLYHPAYLTRRYKDHGGGWRTPDAAVLLERQEAAERCAAEATRNFATLEAKAAAAQRAVQLQLAQVTSGLGFKGPLKSLFEF
jgi:hypothetical protein